MLCRATQDRQIRVESSDRMWSTGEGDGKPLQYSCLENPMNSMKSIICVGTGLVYVSILALNFARQRSPLRAFPGG